MPILGIIASQNYVRIPQTSYESIATTTVGAGGTSTITFSSIPSTYTHLQIRMFARSNRAGNNESTVNLRINGQTSSYSYHRLIGDGSSASSSGGGSTYAMFFYGISSTANIFGAGIFDILDYTNTNKYKTVRTLIGHDQSGAGLFDEEQYHNRDYFR
jgi:hypothetical protein